MKTMVIVISLAVGIAAYAAWAPDWAAPPTLVAERGLYECPSHAEIQATWPARCPICQTVLEKVSSLALDTDANDAAAQTTQYGTPSGSYPPYYPYGTQGYPPYPPDQQYGTQGAYPQNYPYGQQGYPPYPPNYPYSGQGYPPYNPYQYGEGGYGYPPYYPYEQPEPENQYGGLLGQLGRLFGQGQQQQ